MEGNTRSIDFQNEILKAFRSLDIRNLIFKSDSDCDKFSREIKSKFQVIINKLKNEPELSGVFFMMMETMPREMILTFNGIFPEFDDIQRQFIRSRVKFCKIPEIYTELGNIVRKYIKQKLPNPIYLGWLEMYNRLIDDPDASEHMKEHPLCYIRTSSEINPEIVNFMIEAQGQDFHMVDFRETHQKFGDNICWAILTPSNYNLILKYTNNIISIGCGRASVEAELRALNAVVYAYDIEPPESGIIFTDVKKGSIEKISEHPDSTLMLVWPPQIGHSGAEMSSECVLNYTGEYIIYIGEYGSEHDSNVGCTATIEFFKTLSSKGYIAIEWQSIAQVPHGYGYVFIYKKMCRQCKAIATHICSGCKQVKYCSQSCQRMDWNMHKKFCKTLQIPK